MIACIETTNHCNLKCPYCPHKDMTRKKGMMSMELFEKIVDECAEIGIKIINPFMFGEPFTDRRIYEKIRYIRKKYPDIAVTLYSNLGVPIDEDRIEMLYGAGLVVSYSPGVDKDVLEANMKKLKDAGITTEIHVVKSNPVYDELVDEATTFGYRHRTPTKGFIQYNWAGKVESEFWPFKDGHCYRLKNSIVFLWDGRVALCCMDIDGEVIIGDINKESILDIWNGEKMESYRKALKSEKEFCSKCNMPVVENL